MRFSYLIKRHSLIRCSKNPLFSKLYSSLLIFNVRINYIIWITKKKFSHISSRKLLFFFPRKFVSWCTVAVAKHNWDHKVHTNGSRSKQNTATGNRPSLVWLYSKSNSPTPWPFLTSNISAPFLLRLSFSLLLSAGCFTTAAVCFRGKRKKKKYKIRRIKKQQESRKGGGKKKWP